MAKPESLFWRRLKKSFPIDAHLMRVENPAHPGTPDVNCCYNGIEFWPELKQTSSLPKRKDTPVFAGALRPEQIVWHTLRSKAQGRSYIVAEVKEAKRVFVIPGKYAREFNDMPLERLEELTLTVEDMWK